MVLWFSLGLIPNLMFLWILRIGNKSNHRLLCWNIVRTAWSGIKSGLARVCPEFPRMTVWRLQRRTPRRERKQPQMHPWLQFLTMLRCNLWVWQGIVLFLSGFLNPTYHHPMTGAKLRAKRGWRVLCGPAFWLAVLGSRNELNCCICLVGQFLLMPVFRNLLSNIVRPDVLACVCLVPGKSIGFGAQVIAMTCSLVMSEILGWMFKPWKTGERMGKHIVRKILEVYDTTVNSTCSWNTFGSLCVQSVCKIVLALPVSEVRWSWPRLARAAVLETICIIFPTHQSLFIKSYFCPPCFHGLSEKTIYTHFLIHPAASQLGGRAHSPMHQTTKHSFEWPAGRA